MLPDRFVTQAIGHDHGIGVVAAQSGEFYTMGNFGLSTELRRGKSGEAWLGYANVLGVV